MISYFFRTLLYGYQTSMLNSLHHSITPCNNTTIIEELSFFKPCVQMNDLEWSVVISIIYVGGLCGNFIPNFATKYVSPVILLWIGNFPAMIGVVMITFLSNIWAFIIGRFLMGFTAGFTWNLVPIYFSDIAPAHLRGSFGVSATLCHYLATLFSQFLGIFLAFHPGWRILIGLSISLSLLQMILLPLVKNSPRWLIQQNQIEKAKETLQIIRQENVDEEFTRIEAEIKKSQQGTKDISFTKRITNPKVIKNMALMIFMFFMRSFTGSNIVAQYSTDIFMKVGLTIPSIATALTGLSNIVAVIVSLIIVDKFGRRKLMIIGVIGQSVSFGILALSYILTSKLPWISWFSLIGVLGYILSFALAMGPLVPLLQTELFPADLESIGVTASTFVDWSSCALSTFLYPSLANLLKDYVFIPFFLLNLICLVGIVLFLPETKSKSLEELQSSFALQEETK